jgi:hypothetical protein
LSRIKKSMTQQNSSCQLSSTRVTVRGSLILTVVHFMHPTKHCFICRVHAVHHDIEILSINICRRAGFTGQGLPQLEIGPASLRWRLKTRFDINRKESTTCSRVYKIRNQDSGRFDFKIWKRYPPKSSNLQILKRGLNVYV